MKNRKNIFIVIFVLFIIIFLLIGIIIGMKFNNIDKDEKEEKLSNNKKITAMAENFVYEISEMHFDTVHKMIDFKGFCTWLSIYNEELEEYEFKDFDNNYLGIEKNETYNVFLEYFENYYVENLEIAFKDVEFKILEMDKPKLINNTKGLYEVKAKILIDDGQNEKEDEYTFYINKVENNEEYKIVGGDICEMFLNSLLSVSFNNPKAIVENFISYFNLGMYNEFYDLIDLKGYYALNTTYDGEEVDEDTNYEKFYTKFDIRYAEAGEDEDYLELVEVFETCDKESLKTIFEGMEFKIVKIEEPVLIQDTNGLYKVTTNIDVTYEGETESAEYNFYINAVRKDLGYVEYKIVGGDVPGTVLYMLFLNEYYEDINN